MKEQEKYMMGMQLCSEVPSQDRNMSHFERNDKHQKSLNMNVSGNMDTYFKNNFRLGNNLRPFLDNSFSQLNDCSSVLCNHLQMNHQHQTIIPGLSTNDRYISSLISLQNHVFNDSINLYHQLRERFPSPLDISTATNQTIPSKELTSINGDFKRNHASSNHYG